MLKKITSASRNVCATQPRSLLSIQTEVTSILGAEEHRGECSSPWSSAGDRPRRCLLSPQTNVHMTTRHCVRDIQISRWEPCVLQHKPNSSCLRKCAASCAVAGSMTELPCLATTWSPTPLPKGTSASSAVSLHAVRTGVPSKTDSRQGPWPMGDPGRRLPPSRSSTDRAQGAQGEDGGQRGGGSPAESHFPGQGRDGLQAAPLPGGSPELGVLGGTTGPPCVQPPPGRLGAHTGLGEHRTPIWCEAQAASCVTVVTTQGFHVCRGLSWPSQRSGWAVGS